MITTGMEKFEECVKDRLGQIRRISYLKQQIGSIVNDLGFSHFDFSLIPSTKNSLELMLNSIPESFANAYVSEKLYQHDLGLEVALHENQPIYLSSIYDAANHLPPGSQTKSTTHKIQELSNDYGFFDCYTIPLDLDKRSGKVIFSVMSEGEDPICFKSKVMERRAELNILLRAIFSITVNNFPSYFPYKSPLTERQSMVISAYARGAKSTQQVAEQLHISVSTVNKHLEGIKESLGAVSVANAVYIATKKNIITLD